MNPEEIGLGRQKLKEWVWDSRKEPWAGSRRKEAEVTSEPEDTGVPVRPPVTGKRVIKVSLHLLCVGRGGGVCDPWNPHPTSRGPSAFVCKLEINPISLNPRTYAVLKFSDSTLFPLSQCISFARSRLSFCLDSETLRGCDCELYRFGFKKMLFTYP